MWTTEHWTHADVETADQHGRLVAVCLSVWQPWSALIQITIEWSADWTALFVTWPRLSVALLSESFCLLGKLGFQMEVGLIQLVSSWFHTGFKQQFGGGGVSLQLLGSFFKITEKQPKALQLCPWLWTFWLIRTLFWSFRTKICWFILKTCIQGPLLCRYTPSISSCRSSQSRAGRPAASPSLCFIPTRYKRELVLCWAIIHYKGTALDK